MQQGLQGGLDAQPWPTWHNAARDAATREQVIHAVYNLFARRKPEMAGQFQQNKLPDFIRRLEESLYKMATSRDEYADLQTLESRLQQVVSHIVRKPCGSQWATSQSDAQGGGDSFVQQLMGAGGTAIGGTAGGGGDALTPNLHSLQQAQQMAMLQAQQQQTQQAQAQQVPPGTARNGNVVWIEQWGQQEDGPAIPGFGFPAAGGNHLAVAGAPAGQSTAESVHLGGTGNNGGINFSSLAAAGGDVTSAITLPPGMQQPVAARQTSQNPEQPGLGAAPDLAGGLTAAQLNPTFMSNGAPVLLRGTGGSASSAAPALMGGLVPAGNGMLPLGGGGVPVGGGGASMMPTSQQAMAGGGGGMVPQIKPEGGSRGGGMVPVGGSSAGIIMSLAPQHQHQHQHQQMVMQQHQQQQMVMQQHQQQMGVGGMGGTGYGSIMFPGPNGFGGALLPIGGQAGRQAQHVLMHQHQPSPALLQQQQQQQQQDHHHQQQQQQHYVAQLAHAGTQRRAAGTPPLPLLQQQQQQQPVQPMGGVTEQKPLAGLGDQQVALPAFNLDADQSFNLLGNAFADVEGPVAGVGPAATVDARKQQILKQQRWLLFLRHCARCQLSEGQCQYGRNCTVAKQLWKHLVHCKETSCEYARCNPSRELLRHHQKCSSPNCPVCAPVKQYVSKQRQLVFHRKTASLSPELRQHLLLHLQQNPKAREVFQQRHGVDVNTIFATLDTGSNVVAAMASPAAAAAAAAAAPPLPAMAAVLAATGSVRGAATAAAMPAQPVLPMVSGGGQAGMCYMSQGQPQHQQPGVAMGATYGVEALAAPKRQRTHVVHENMGTSLLEYFTEQQIQTHVAKLQKKDGVQVRGLPKPTPPPADYFDVQDAESNCKVCELNRLTFEPPSLYCFSCGQRIKRNQVYYGTPATHEIKGVWCHPCYQEIKTETVPLDGFNIRKTELEKRKNDDEVEEGWVQCDQCEGWVHQICGLFNKGRNDLTCGFLCPFCLRDGLRTGDRCVPIERPQAMLTARDLPTCDLSEHLQKRLERVLQQERELRAHMEGRHPSEIRTAEGLTVRVVNNVVKRNDVRSRFHTAVQGKGGYPDAFMYKQKVILLFQSTDGVDLCLYCLYMQEYGEDVPPPNKKSVYLSYLDSVKYFQPEDVQAAGRGMALRTMVYHEMLLGYLEYIKARGFESMFIWACPPLAGDDYILYCHPFKQKTPRSDRLREWYHVMLNKAKEEGTVTYVSNMWDTYFEGGRDHRLEHLSITQLPYYDGDYWPGEAENLLASITSEAAGGCKGGQPSHKAGGSRSKASLKVKARVGPATGTTTEELLRRLGDTIQGMREDFIVVHLQEPCSFCREYMSGGMRYYHPNPPQKVVVKSERTFDGINLEKPGSEASRTFTYTRFALCSKCYSAELAGHGRGLPIGMALQELLPAPNQPIPPNRDTVQEMENEFFDTRTAFLSLCQGNHYQFDSLRRAKHSSMMVLYHLHNPTVCREAPAFTCTCNVCSREIQGGEGFRCGTCTDFDMCNNCWINPAVPRHEHPLVRHARDIDERRNRLSQEQLAARNQALHRTMQVLQHASECTDPRCPSTSCARVKAMYNHAMQCAVKLSGNCQYCRRMWMLLQMHATQCTVANCQVPRCSQLRNMRRQQATRAEDKRRAAYRNMLRQQTGA